MAVQPKRAVLHEVVTSATSPDGTFYIVGYVFDADHDRHLVFATSANFEDPRVLPLMKDQEINLTLDQQQTSADLSSRSGCGSQPIPATSRRCSKPLR
jgi:hypothetical protein